MAEPSISTKYIDTLVEAVSDVNSSLVALSESHRNDISERKAEIEELKNSFNKGDISSKQLIKGLVDISKEIRTIDYDVKNSAKFNKAESSLTSKLAKVLDGQKLDKAQLDKVITAISNLNTSAMAGSNPILKGSTDNKKLEEILKEIRKSTNKQDSTLDKIYNFMGVQPQEIKKGFRTFTEDLIMGLASSKFIGGALTDTFKLLGLIGGTYLNKICSFLFGDKFGKAVGAGIIALSQVIAPLLTTAIFAGFANILTKGALGKGISSLFGGAFKGGVFKNLASFFSFGPKTMTSQMARQTLKAGTVFKDAKTGKLRKVVEGFAKADGTKSMRTVAVKGAEKVAGKGVGKALGKTALKKIPGIGLLAGLGFGAGRALQGDWTGAGLELLSGAASTIPGYGTAASLLLDGAIAARDVGAFKKMGKISIPKGASGVAGTALKFGSSIGMIGILYTLIKKHYAKQEKLQEENNGFWRNLISALKDSIFGKLLGLGGNNGGGGGSSIPEGAEKRKFGSGGADRRGAKNINGLEVAKDGSILNLHKFSQDQASQVLQAYEKADPTAFNRIYEWADAGHANFDSFKTDAVKKVNGKTTGALMYKGASADLDALRKELIAKGMDPAKANALSFTSGKLTGSNKSHGVGGWKSHNNQYGLAFDLGGGSAWTQADYDRYGSVVSDFYRNRASQRFNISYEREGQGKSTGKHWDAKPIANYRPAGAVQNEKEAQEQQKVTAERHQLQAMQLVKSLEGEKRFKEIAKANITKSPEELEAEYKKELLNKYGVFAQKGKDGQEHWMYTDKSTMQIKEFDPTGNLDFLKKTMTNVTNYNQ